LEGLVEGRVLTNERILQSVGDAWVPLTATGKQRNQHIGAEAPESLLKPTLKKSHKTPTLSLSQHNAQLTTPVRK